MPFLSLSLSDDGPVIGVFVSVTASRRYVATRFKNTVPEPVRVRALIDTGAAYSCFDSSVFRRLNLAPTYEVTILTPGTGDVPQQLNQYEVDLEILSPEQQVIFRFERLAAVEAPLVAQGIEGLIGRDILSRCLFIFDSAANTFSLAF